MRLKDELLDKLVPYEQEHILAFWEELTVPQRQSLAAEVEQLNLENIHALFTKRLAPPLSASLIKKANEPPTFRLSDLRERIDGVSSWPAGGDGISPQEAIAAGEAALRAGKLAVAVVAGGQGTRLDFLHAKGIYPIGPVSGVSLFQIHVERILAMGKKYGVRIPFCIQTSPATHEETIEYFRDNNNFGLADEDVLIFCQGTMPSVDWNTGKLLMASKWSIARSPDGHGGFLASINSPQKDSPIPIVARAGILAELQHRGIEEIFYFQVDNPVIDICSPEFIGYHLLSHSQFSSQAIRKVDPLERVGNFVMVDGRLYVIEYSDLPAEAGSRRKPDGSLFIWAGSIAVHMMNVAFLREKAFYSESMPFHIAKKRVPYVVLDHESESETGESLYGTKIKPEGTNGVKFEKFIFDLLPQANNPIVVEIETATGFAPLKNHPREAKDTPAMVRRMLCDLYRQWLQSCGVEVAPDVEVEISPLFANSATELFEKLKQRDLVPDSGLIDQSVYWSGDM
ncbi:MAG: UTP--glucose-1-phosphate uridylyltransferase [Planctomycetia bacterium]|nr:UTP--glucose-1-phosphate uridylyltransferase [Planctomycetia bacterium]